MKIKTRKLSPQVLNVILNSKVKVGVVTPPKEKASPLVYREYKKVMEALEGVWQPSKGCFHFPFHVQLPRVIKKILDTGEVPLRKKTYQEYFTPVWLAELMAKLAANHFMSLPNPPKYIAVLEPSAGRGALVDAIKERTEFKTHVLAVEIQKYNSALIRRGLDIVIVSGDFLKLDAPAGINTHFLRKELVLMNPPFADGAWLKHVKHAYEFMSFDGIMIAIVPSSAKASDLDFVEDKASACITPLKSGLFNDSGTSVGVSLLTLGVHPNLVWNVFRDVVEVKSCDKAAGDIGTPAEYIKAIREDLLTALKELDALEAEL